MMRWIVLTMLLVPFMASAADFWDGNAALQRGDADFESGLNVTSNSFPPGTKITIVDEDTGKTVTATVTGRIEGQSDILMLMSPKTAEALGVSQGNLGRVRVTVPAGTDSAAAAQSGDQTVSRDPDVNPAASAAAAPEAAAGTTAIAQTPESASSAPAAESAAPAESSTTPAAETPAAETPAAEVPATEAPAATTPTEETMPAATPAETAQTAPAATPEVAPEQAGTAAQAATPASGEDADAAAILSQAQARSPQKEMFQPPREDQKFVYHPETTPAQTGAATPASSATVASVSEPAAAPPASAQGELPLADVTAPEESRPQEIVGAGTAVPPAAASETALAAPEVAPAGETAVAQAPTQTEVIGQGAAPPAGTPAPQVALAAPEAPAAARPAGTAATTPAAATGASTAVASAATPSTSGSVPRQPTAVAASASAVPKTGPGTFYLQLAAYGSEKGARDLAAKLAPTYPAIVLAPVSSGSSTFKVVIGPLNKAESGTLLLWFRYRGFPDAFLKQQ